MPAGYAPSVKARQARKNLAVWVRGFRFCNVSDPPVISSSFRGLLLLKFSQEKRAPTASKNTVQVRLAGLALG